MKSVEMYPPKGGAPVKVLPSQVETMTRRGWVLDQPKPSKKSRARKVAADAGQRPDKRGNPAETGPSEDNV